MPHIILEYTANRKLPDFKEVFLRIHQILARVGKIQISNCKSRAIELDNYLIGYGKNDEAFIHLDVAFLEGRSTQLKQAIGNQLLDLLCEYYQGDLERERIQITVEIRDILGPTYFKLPENSLQSLAHFQYE